RAGRQTARPRGRALLPAPHPAPNALLVFSFPRFCSTGRLPFPRGLHPRFADYLAARWPIPRNWTWRWMRWFHNAGRGTMVSTASLASELRSHGFNNVLRWPRGVDSAMFHPSCAHDLGLKRPVFLTVGRLAVEKNLDAFL